MNQIRAERHKRSPGNWVFTAESLVPRAAASILQEGVAALSFTGMDFALICPAFML